MICCVWIFCLKINSMSRFRDLTFWTGQWFLSFYLELSGWATCLYCWLLSFSATFVFANLADNGFTSLVCVDNVKKAAAELVIGIADKKNLFVHTLGGKFHLNLTRYWRHRRISLENLTRGVSKLFILNLN